MSDVLGATILARAQPIGLDELNALAALQDRIDTKFLMERRQFEGALGELVGDHGLKVLEIDGKRSFRYRSVYYDTPDLQSFRDHTQKRRRRFKVRTRHYVDTGLRRLEVKYKGTRGRTIKKSSTEPLGYFDPLTPSAEGFVERTLESNHERLPSDGLVPLLMVEYERTTLVSPDGAERVTYDAALRFQHVNGATARIDDDHLMLETKSDCLRGLTWNVLKRHGARPASFSKYLAGIALTDDSVVCNDLARVLRTMFHTDPSGSGPAGHDQVAGLSDQQERWLSTSG